ncbi:DUF4244 domain-containing protein [Arthrobacter sp. zg-Y769]|uniref:DUF4244 domain-containing protein n=1 Tax=Arthrobacter sp. zg-Y769 TaxID=2894191 RepID=UPI001E550592|nr:DUF4244 domain-containing protein [Arthrobacter sp. zg-Y769]MCC9203988.1 DUF4244 domain-containing protein [Arthrobacter sp. zg-Y769]
MSLSTGTSTSTGTVSTPSPAAARLETGGGGPHGRPACPNPESDGSHGVYSLSGRGAAARPRLTLAKPPLAAQSPVHPPVVAPANPPWTDREAGMATAEYAIATLAAVAFAGLLAIILGGDEVRGMLVSLIRSALTLG